MKSIKYSIPGTDIEVEVFSTELHSIGLIVRDLSIPLPEFNPVTRIEDLGNYNVLHQDWLIINEG